MSQKLDRWNPLTPLAAAVLLIVIAYTGPPPWSAPAAVLMALSLAAACGVGRTPFRLALAVALPSLFVLLLLSAVAPPPPPPGGGEDFLRVGPLRIASEALWEAVGFALRLAASVAALGWIIAGIDPRRLTRALADRGLPAWSAYVVVASLEAVPQARRSAREVLDAQRCRGLRVRRGAAGRLRALLPLVGPLAVSLVVESEERALALEARAFDPRRRRTALTPLPDPRAERALRLVLWGASFALVLWRLVPAAWWSR
ncbi:MAG: energy-coupling factor transporter transmembrane protein EcfT [Gemmatimonadota bacterium]|nr:energy-coupling factor transporter transmembrane protein EcfT [Gemmatimonadota bacterium]